MPRIPAWLRTKRTLKFIVLLAVIVITIYLMKQANLPTSYIFKNGLILTTPIALVAVAETISERSGVINVGVEGITLLGALVTALATFVTGSPWIGILVGLTAGGGLGLLHGLWCIKLRANHIVSGIAMNILAIGLAYVIPNTVWGWRGVSVYLPRINIWILVGVMVAIVVVAQIALFKTLWGLRVRTTGEDPKAVDTAGGNVHKIRYLCMILNGVLCGLAGAFLMNYTGRFVHGMVAGRGYMGIAAMVVGGYVPVWALGGAYLFGFVFALQMVLQAFIPSQFALMLPYIVTVIAMAGFLGKVKVPKALGKHYVRE